MRFRTMLSCMIVCALACASFACLVACDASEQRASEGVQSTAMVIVLGDGGVLFIDQDTETPYFPTFDSAQVTDESGSSVSAADLATGNIVRVTGDGIMLSSYPGQYPGITLVEVVKQGAPADAARYEELVAQIWQPRDSAEPAHASLEYTTDMAMVTLSLQRCGYTWQSAEDGSSVTADAPHPVQFDAESLPEANVGEATEASVSFDVAATSVSVVRWSESGISSAAAATASGSPADIAADALMFEPVATNADFGGSSGPGSASGIASGSASGAAPGPAYGSRVGTSASAQGIATFVIEPGWRYVVYATFDAGEVTYAFTVSQ